jgi:hypothetical protein
MKHAMTIVAALTVAGCITSPPAPPDTEHRYVVLGPQGVPVARVVTAAAQCPTLEVDGATVSMSVRMPAETIPARPSRPDLSPPKPAAFPVTTCEAVLPVNAIRASAGGQSLPLPKASPQRIVLIGDTGCRVLPTFNMFQSCDDPVAWPFERVANMAADTAPDLVVHVGDYHYRDGPCDLAHPGCFASPWGYGYDTWHADFFRPARRLLAAAPWVVVRGNHESCNRAGQGWFRFLDPRPVAPRQNCNLAADDDIGNYSAPYAVPLGRDADTQLLVFDSSWVGVTPIPPEDLMYRNYRAQFEELFALAARTPHAIFTSHHPVLGFASNPASPQSPFPGNRGLQSVLTPLYGNALFPPVVAATLSGHNHLLELVNFATPFPPQLITGNGGTAADTPFPSPFPPVEPAPGAVVAELVTTTRFGFMTMQRQSDGWSLRAWDVDGNLMSSCTLAARKLNCSPIANP